MENGFERQMLVLAERTDMHWASAASVPESFTATTLAMRSVDMQLATVVRLSMTDGDRSLVATRRVSHFYTAHDKKKYK